MSTFPLLESASMGFLFGDKMKDYTNKIIELRAWAKDDIVPADLKWLCTFAADELEKIDRSECALRIVICKECGKEYHTFVVPDCLNCQKIVDEIKTD